MMDAPHLPMSARQVLDRYFLEVRAKLLDIAAVLDRIDRAGELPTADPRLANIDRAIGILQSAGPDRAERIQMVFSRPYDAHWMEEKPTDKGS